MGLARREKFIISLRTSMMPLLVSTTTTSLSSFSAMAGRARWLLTKLPLKQQDCSCSNSFNRSLPVNAHKTLFVRSQPRMHRDVTLAIWLEASLCSELFLYDQVSRILPSHSRPPRRQCYKYFWSRRYPSGWGASQLCWYISDFPNWSVLAQSEK